MCAHDRALCGATFVDPFGIRSEKTGGKPEFAASEIIGEIADIVLFRLSANISSEWRKELK